MIQISWIFQFQPTIKIQFQLDGFFNSDFVSILKIVKNIKFNYRIYFNIKIMLNYLSRPFKNKNTKHEIMDILTVLY